MENFHHVPVLQTTVLDLLAPRPGTSVIDVTLGLGGHAGSFLQATSPDGRLIGLDADEENLRTARERLSPFEGRTRFLHANFAQLPSLGLPPTDILFADLGLSSPHVDDASRGFSFRFDGPLDLRFDRSKGATAAERIASASEDELLEVLKRYGEFPGVYRLTKHLLEHPPVTTTELKSLVEGAFRRDAPKVLPQVFQALRIWVNDEMGALDTLLRVGPTLLLPGGRMAVISYHSLEDRLVKHAFRALSEPERDPVTGKAVTSASFRLLTKRPIRPSDDEIRDNPRSRSALLRIIERPSS